MIWILDKSVIQIHTLHSALAIERLEIERYMILFVEVEGNMELKLIFAFDN